MEVALVSDDIQIDKSSIENIMIYSEKILRKAVIHIAIETKEAKQVYTAPLSVSAKQIELFFNERFDINVINQVAEEQAPARQASCIISDIKQLDMETVERMRSSRIIAGAFTGLSVLSLVVIFIGIHYPLIYFLIPLCPIAATIFYIMRQQDVMFDGSKSGKPSIFMSYLFNPILSAVLVWVIILSEMKLTCLDRHPYSWLAGAVGTAVFIFSILRFISGSRKKIIRIIGWAFLALLFGSQITAVMLFYIHI
jgi:hypothetical protein